MSASWYDVLGVDADASVDEIRDAWRGSIEGLDPTDRRFRLYNDAAAVLLDGERRAEYDAGLSAPAAPSATPAAAGTGLRDAAGPTGTRRFGLRRGGAAAAGAATAGAAASGGTEATEATGADPATARRVPEPFARLARPRLLAAMAVVVLLLAAPAAYLQFWRTDAADVESAMAEARQAAEIGLPKVFTYDHRFPDRDHDQASRTLTGELREEYDALWEEAIAPNLERTEGTASSEVLGSAVVGGDTGEAEILVVLKTVTGNAEQTQQLTLALTASLVEEDGVWLIEEIDGWDPEAVTDEDESTDDPGRGDKSEGDKKGSGRDTKQDRKQGRDGGGG